MDEDTFTVDKGVEPRIAAAEKLQGLTQGESAMVDRTRSKDEAARLFWMQGAVKVQDTKRSVAILAVVSLLSHRGPRCSRSAGAHPCSSVEKSLLPSRSPLQTSRASKLPRDTKCFCSATSNGDISPTLTSLTTLEV